MAAEFTSPDRNAGGLVAQAVDPLRYDWEFTLDAYEVPGIVANMIPPGSRVLDVGCGTGRLSRLLADACGADIVGIEADAKRAARAAERGLRVHVGYFNREMVRENGPVDIVLMADVLEHLPNPQEMLLVAREALTPEGAIIVSVPNVAHWSVRLCLLRGKFDHSQYGIMDATHLRWFTAATVKALLASSGFKVVEYRATAGQWVPENDGRAPLRWLSRRSRNALLRAGSRRWPALFGAQHVLKAEMV